MFNLMTLPLMQETAASGLGGGGTPDFMTIIMLSLVFVVFWFFLIRPQRKKQKETEAMIAAVKKNDKVVTIGGMHGVVSSVKEKTVVIKMDDNCKIEFNKSAISLVVPKDDGSVAEEK